MIKDYSYITKFDKKDLPFIYRLAEEIRATHDPELVNEFNNTSEKIWNDHNPILTIGNKQVRPLETLKSDDLVTTEGVAQCIRQIQGTSTVRWTLMAKGTGLTAPAVGQLTLVSEQLPRVDMTLYGWTEYAGASLRFAGIYGETSPTCIITECGIFSSTAASLLNRNYFGTNFVHVINEDGYVISSIIEFVPVV